MTQPWRLVPPSLLVAGIALIAWSVLRGGASVAVVFIVPVVTGGSAPFILGVLLVVSGFFLLPLAFGYSIDIEEGPDGEPRAPKSGGSTSPWGGLVLVGPLPIFFGSARNVSRRTYWFAVLAGLVVSAAALVVLLFAF